MTIQSLDPTLAREEFARVRRANPLVVCLTNTVAEAFSADILAAAGASPVMVHAHAEAPEVARRSDALLINIGTMTAEDFATMRLTARSANYAHHPWVLDPVGAGLSLWRDSMISRLLLEHPSIIRANASEVSTLAGNPVNGHGTDSTLESSAALDVAKSLAKDLHCIVVLTGETDYVTDSSRTLALTGGASRARTVVGTGCALSALVAAYTASAPDLLVAAASACALAKRAAERVQCPGYGTFRAHYLDAIEAITQEACACESSRT